MYAKINNGVVEKYPYTIGDLRKDNPNTSFPKQISDSILTEFGVVTVLEVSPPTVEYSKTWHEITPVLEDGVWKQAYSVSDLSAEELNAKDAEAAKGVRTTRDKLIAETDWIVIKNLELNQNVPGVWEVYRQNLRDVPAQAGFPHNVTWPTKPE